MRKDRDIVPGERSRHLPQGRERITGTLERVSGLGHIRRHVALECLDGFEFLLMPDPPDKRDIDGLSIDVAVEVEQEHFQQRGSVVEHRTAAETRNAVMASAANVCSYSVDAVLETTRGA